MVNTRIDRSSPVTRPAARRADTQAAPSASTPASGAARDVRVLGSTVAAGGGSTTTSQPAAPAPVSVLSTVFSALGTLFNGLMSWLQRLFGSSTSSPVPTTPGAPVSAPVPIPPAAPGARAAPTAPASQPPLAAGGALAQAIAATPAGQPLALGAATYSVNDFGSNPAHAKAGESDKQGIDLPATIGGIAGAGVDKTVLRMTPRTSTKAGDIPTTPMTTNQYSLLRIMGSPNLHDFTLQATDQGHLYNGLRLHMVTNARVTNVKVTGVPGNASSPPGETFGINDYRSNGSVYTNIEVDGQGLGASGFGANDAQNLTIDHGYFHGNAHGIGATFWQSRNITLTDCTTTNNHNGLNFERVAGTVNIVRPRISNIAGSHDISIGTDQESATYNIIDPVLAPGQKLRILVGKNYLGKPSPQKRSDIHVIINGVDRTNDVVQWV